MLAIVILQPAIAGCRTSHECGTNDHAYARLTEASRLAGAFGVARVGVARTGASSSLYAGLEMTYSSSTIALKCGEKNKAKANCFALAVVGLINWGFALLHIARSHHVHSTVRANLYAYNHIIAAADAPFHLHRLF